MQGTTQNSFFTILRKDLHTLKTELDKFQERMPHNLITEQMEVRFKQFIEQARILFEEAADNALKSIRSANKVKEISTWHHDSMSQVNQVLSELDEKKSVDSISIYEFATSKKIKIEQQLQNYANELEKYVAFRASFTPMQLRKIIKFSFEEEDKHTEQRIERLPTINIPGTWGVNPGSRDAIRFSCSKPFLLTGFDVIGNWDEEFRVKYWIFKNDEQQLEEQTSMQQDSALYYDEYRAVLKINKGEGVYIEKGEKVDIVVEYQHKMSIPYYKGGKKFVKVKDECQLMFENSPRDDNCTTQSEGMLPTLYGIVMCE